jgi:hypothetical protein
MSKQKLFKQQVFLQCKNILEQRIAHAHQAMQSAQEAANSEDKSSAGDKYETSRAMGQLDRNMNAKQMAEAQTELNALMKLTMDYDSEKIISGSMVETNNGIYFIAAGIGMIEVEKKKVAVLSPHSPLAKVMIGKTKNETFEFNGKSFVVGKVS